MKFLNNLKRKIFSEPLRLFIPEKIYAAVGKECNIYFDNLITSIAPQDYFFEVKCKIGRNERYCYTVIPQAENVGEHPLTIKIYDKFGLAEEVQSTLIVSPEISTKQNFSLLLIGDSQTAGEGYPDQLYLHLSKEENITFNMVGSNSSNYSIPQPGGVAHEGFGGWGWNTFFTNYNVNASSENDGLDPSRPWLRDSSFLFPDGNSFKFDFEQYCKKYNASKYPDYIIIMLGTNNIFCCQSDMEVDKAWKTEIYPYMKKMVEIFRQCNPSCHIAFNTLIPGAASQDAFGKCYGASYNMRRWRLNLHTYHQYLLRAAKELNIPLIPVHCAIDCRYGFPQQDELLNANSDKMICRTVNAVHPNRSGYNQIADAVFAYLKYTVTSE